MARKMQRLLVQYKNGARNTLSGIVRIIQVELLLIVLQTSWFRPIAPTFRVQCSHRFSELETLKFDARVP